MPALATYLCPSGPPTRASQTQHTSHPSPKLKDFVIHSAQAMMALANVERAHDQAVASCQASQASWTHASLASCIIGERITEPSSQLVVKEPEPAQEEARDMVAVRAKLAAHQQAAMKIVAQHMIQQVDAANAHHERVKSRLSVQLAELGPTDTSMDQRVRRRSIERQIKAAERVHAGQLEALEEKVCGASFEHIPECVHRNRHRRTLCAPRVPLPPQCRPCVRRRPWPFRTWRSSTNGHWQS